jgi:hypothetical protein
VPPAKTRKYRVDFEQISRLKKIAGMNQKIRCRFFFSLTKISPRGGKIRAYISD